MDKFGLLSIVFGSAFCVVFVIKLLGYLWGRYSDDLKTDKSLKTTVLVWGIVIFFFFPIPCFELIIIHVFSSKQITYVIMFGIMSHDSLDVIRVLNRSGNKIVVPLPGAVNQKEQLFFLHVVSFFLFFFLLKQCCFFFFLETNNVVSYLKRLCHTSIKVVVVVCNESTHRNSSQSFVMFQLLAICRYIVMATIYYVQNVED